MNLLQSMHTAMSQLQRLCTVTDSYADAAAGWAAVLIADLVALVCVYDGVIATAAVCIIDRGLPDISKFPDKHLFFLVVTVTSTLAAAARLLYQRALTIAPLSLTVPYLAFTPAFVMMVSPLFLVGEVPSPLGMLGA